MKPDEKSSVVLIVPVPCSQPYAPVPLFNTKLSFTSVAVSPRRTVLFDFMLSVRTRLSRESRALRSRRSEEFDLPADLAVWVLLRDQVDVRTAVEQRL